MYTLKNIQEHAHKYVHNLPLTHKQAAHLTDGKGNTGYWVVCFSLWTPAERLAQSLISKTDQQATMLASPALSTLPSVPCLWAQRRGVPQMSSNMTWIEKQRAKQKKERKEWKDFLAGNGSAAWVDLNMWVSESVSESVIEWVNWDVSLFVSLCLPVFTELQSMRAIAWSEEHVIWKSEHLCFHSVLSPVNREQEMENSERSGIELSSFWVFFLHWKRKKLAKFVWNTSYLIWTYFK